MTERSASGWHRSGWVEDGLWTSPVALGVLVIGGVAQLVLEPRPGRDAAFELQVTVVVAVPLLAALARVLVGQVLRRREALVPRRHAAARVAVAAYVPLALLVTLVDPPPDQLAVWAGALAMTSPGVLLVVLDGSPPGRAVLRVLLAAALVPVAGVVGYVVGFLAFFVGTLVASFLFGVLAGHLVTFVPLALVGPGEVG